MFLYVYMYVYSVRFLVVVADILRPTLPIGLCICGGANEVKFSFLCKPKSARPSA